MLSAVRQSQAAFQSVCSGRNRAQEVPCECPGRLRADRLTAPRLLRYWPLVATALCPALPLGTGADVLGALAARSLCPGCRSPAGLGAVPSTLSRRFSSVLFRVDPFPASGRRHSGLVTAGALCMCKIGNSHPIHGFSPKSFSQAPRCRDSVCTSSAELVWARPHWPTCGSAGRAPQSFILFPVNWAAGQVCPPGRPPAPGLTGCRAGLVSRLCSVAQGPLSAPCSVFSSGLPVAFAWSPASSHLWLGLFQQVHTCLLQVGHVSALTPSKGG